MGCIPISAFKVVVVCLLCDKCAGLLWWNALGINIWVCELKFIDCICRKLKLLRTFLVWWSGKWSARGAVFVSLMCKYVPYYGMIVAWVRP